MNFKLEAKINILEMCIFLLCPLYLVSFNKEHRVCERTPCHKVEWPDSQQKSLREQVAAWVLEVSAFASSLGISVAFAMLELTRDERSMEGRALQGCAENSPGCKERMKESSYETGLGKAQSGRKWVQGLGQGVAQPAGQARREGATSGTRSQSPGKRLQGKGRAPGFRRRPGSGGGWELGRLRVRALKQEKLQGETHRLWKELELPEKR